MWYKYRVTQRLDLFHNTPYCIGWNCIQTWLFFFCLAITVYFQAWDIWFSSDRVILYSLVFLCRILYCSELQFSDFVLARLLDCCIRRYRMRSHQAAVSFFWYLHFLSTNKFINSLSPLNFSKREVRKTSWLIRLIHSTNSITAVIDSFVHSFTHAMTSSIYRNLIGC